MPWTQAGGSRALLGVPHLVFQNPLLHFVQPWRADAAVPQHAVVPVIALESHACVDGPGPRVVGQENWPGCVLHGKHCLVNADSAGYLDELLFGTVESSVPA